jgi:hypothetical protein
MLRSAAKQIMRPVFLAVIVAACSTAHADSIDSTQSNVYLSGTASATVTDGAVVSSIMATDDSKLTVTGGQVSSISMRDNATADITGGDISWLRVGDNSSVRITGLQELSWLLFTAGNGRVEIVADDVTYSGGHLSGTWANGQSFSFWAIKESSILGGGIGASLMPEGIAITAVPEPSSYALFLIGCAAVLCTSRARRSA